MRRLVPPDRPVAAMRPGGLLKALANAGLAVVLLGGMARGADLEHVFRNPPESAKPWCYWYWISDNISKEGITKDLEAMARFGIGEALIGNIRDAAVPMGTMKVLSEEWWGCVEHAVREGGRTGVKVGLFNCPGWSQSGGPWIKPEQAMRYVAMSELRVKGPQRIEQKLAAPKAQFQQIAVLAFPAPHADTASIASASPKISCTPAVDDAAKWIDGDLATAVALPTKVAIEIETASPFTARSLSLHPAEGGVQAKCELDAVSDDGSWHKVREFSFDRQNAGVNVGFMPFGPVTVSFDAVTAKKFRVVLSGCGGNGKLAEIELSGAARLERYVEKQLGKMFPAPLPSWDTYMWPQPGEPDAASLAVPSDAVKNITKNVADDGTLTWDVPEGEWVILRTGMTPTGTRNAPSSPEGEGLEADKMNREIASAHFDAYVGNLLKRMPAGDRKAFRHVVADSYEMGSENWTDGFAEDFKKTYGYDPLPWLPVLTGRIVGSADRSERFLWDLRRLVADRVARDYVGGLREKCELNGLRLWLENYGHWGFPAEFLQYGGASDDLGGEYWLGNDLGSIECRAASSASHIYGKPVTSAESFTAPFSFKQHPRELKARGDWAFCEGINHYVLHVYIHQPDERRPGVNAWFGTDFNRNSTWFESGTSWVEYVRRCCAMLQQGRNVADVAYFIGEDAPKMTGVRKPELPAGYNFDYINADVIRKDLRVKDGKLVLPNGTTYRLLVLPDQQTMRPELLEKIRDLAADGAAIFGNRPTRSPSMKDFPGCDERVKRLAQKIWGDGLMGRGGGMHSIAAGKGRVFGGDDLRRVLDHLGVAPDFVSVESLRYTHRATADADIYFVANPKAQDVSTTAAFRAGDRAPEFFWPESGRIEKPASYDLTNGTVRLPLHLGPNESVFVVFRGEAAQDRVVNVTRNGQPLFDLSALAPHEVSTAPQAGSFTLAIWAKPDADTILLKEANEGIHGLHEARNDALMAPHGGTFSAEGDHAGCGLAVGRNGVAVFEHGAGYFSPTLVHAAPLTDWTHVAVVYRDGRPSLYLNGSPARTGLKSRRTVHCAPSPDPDPRFRGALGEFEVSSRALRADEIAALMKKMPRAGDGLHGPPIKLLCEDGSVVAHVRQPGTYSWRTAAGAAKTIDVPRIAEPFELDGPWDVRFDAKWGGPSHVTFDTLADWTKRSEEGIRFYSGVAIYRKTFSLAPDAGTALQLDLGEVGVIATVRLNGSELGTLWKKPYVVNISRAARSGANTLEVGVVNTWWNRLVGDEQPGAPRRWTHAASKHWKAGDTLLPSGLIGPVRIVTETEIR